MYLCYVELIIGHMIHCLCQNLLEHINFALCYVSNKAINKPKDETWGKLDEAMTRECERGVQKVLLNLSCLDYGKTKRT